MKVIIFSYNREKKLKSLLKELEGYDITVIDDGSEWTREAKNDQILRTHHEGKEGFWKKWIVARQICLGSDHDYYLFLADDFEKVNIEWISNLENYDWKDNLFAINILNDKRTECWGKHQTDQEPFDLEGINLTEVGFVDCGFLTNRLTLSNIEIDPVSHRWFDRPDKSSGVGHNLTMSLREIDAKMMMPTPSLCEHGNHFSQMHYKHREDTNIELDMPILCLNLEDRPQKWEYAKRECWKINAKPKRFRAIKETPGWHGCRKSHLEMIELLKGNDEFLIIEDDILFCEEEPLQLINKAMSQLPSDWDMLYLGATLNEPLERHSENLFRLTGGWTTHGIIYNNQNGVADYILENCPETKIDVWYLEEIQQKFNCFITYPMVATQRNGYSDTINRNVDYSVILQRFYKYAR